MPEAQRNPGKPPAPARGRAHCRTVKRSTKRLRQEGFRQYWRIKSTAAADEAVIETKPLGCNRRELAGPFDVIGDVHGCASELRELLKRLNYEIRESRNAEGEPVFRTEHEDGRRLVFLGDLVDRGPDPVGVLQLVMDAVEHGVHLAVPGNHDIRLMRALGGRTVNPRDGLPATLELLNAASEGFRQRVKDFVNGLPSHLELDGGNLVAAHAGLTEDLHGRASRIVRDFAVYGGTTGETDDQDRPIRRDWARDYRGRAAVVYGHTPTEKLGWVNNTLCIDTGCAYGGELTALRYPEKETASSPALKVYCEPPAPPTADDGLTKQQASDHLLDIEDLSGPISTRTALLGTRPRAQSQRVGRARNDDQPHRRPAPADLPAADHVALRHGPRGRPP